MASQSVVVSSDSTCYLRVSEFFHSGHINSPPPLAILILDTTQHIYFIIIGTLVHSRFPTTNFDFYASASLSLVRQGYIIVFPSRLFQTYS
jgi:hypothetical protein